MQKEYFLVNEENDVIFKVELCSNCLEKLQEIAETMEATCLDEHEEE